MPYGFWNTSGTLPKLAPSLNLVKHFSKRTSGCQAFADT